MIKRITLTIFFALIGGAIGLGIALAALSVSIGFLVGVFIGLFMGTAMILYSEVFSKQARHLRHMVGSFANYTAQLKLRTPYFPETLVVEEGSRPHSEPRQEVNVFCFAVTTLVRKQFNDRWYTIHCVERQCVEATNQEEAKKKAMPILLQLIMKSAHYCQNLASFSDRFEEDPLQISERMRLERELRVST